MRKTLVYLFLACLNWPLLSAPVIVRGQAPGAEGKVIRIQAFSDMISYRRLTLARDTIDATGHFALSFALTRNAYIQLMIDFHSAEMLAEPDAEYEIHISAFENPVFREELNPFLEPRYLYFQLQHPEKHPLLLGLDSLNALYESHLLEHFQRLSRGGKAAGTDTLQAHFQKKLPYLNPYLRTAVKYRVASLEDLARADSREGLMKRYLHPDSLWYGHPDFMEFFNSFFSKYLTHLSRPIPYRELAYRVNETRDYAEVLDLLGRDSLLVNDRIREGVLLRNLRELYYNPDFDKQAVLEILKQMQASTRFPEHRDIAGNLITRLHRLSRGTLPPTLPARQSNGSHIALSDYAGKYLYVQFWTSVCEACKTDWIAMQSLYPRFSEEVRFLSISVDTEEEHFRATLKQLDYPWDFGWFGGDYDVVDDYSLRAFPSYILLDREGKILQYPARSPADQLDVMLGRLLSAEKRIEESKPLPGTDERR
jgi:thiol-disulfide isomerase/thioredoxin